MTHCWSRDSQVIVGDESFLSRWSRGGLARVSMHEEFMIFLNEIFNMIKSSIYFLHSFKNSHFDLCNYCHVFIYKPFKFKIMNLSMIIVHFFFCYKFY